MYVEALSKELALAGMKSVIAAPSERDETYCIDGLRVQRFASARDSKTMLNELYGAGDPVAARSFERILNEEDPDILHLHAFTRAASILLVDAAKRRGVPVVFTFHTPSVSCQRGTLMLWGRAECDGVLNVRRCTACSLQGAGLARWLSHASTLTPSMIGKAVAAANRSGGIWTVLQMKELMATRRRTFEALTAQVDVIVALRAWVNRLLLLNKVPAEKIFFSPHGVKATTTAGPLADPREGPLRVVFLGRADPAKGIDTLIKAVRAAPDVQVELHLHGVDSRTNQPYFQHLQALRGGDVRIDFRPSVPHHEIIPLLRTYHLLAMPSRTLETGPLVILEAFLAGIPVLGSRLGNIAEWIRHEENGMLVDFDSVGGWTKALRLCAENREFVLRLQQGITVPRTMRDVAKDMADLYRRVGRGSACIR